VLPWPLAGGYLTLVGRKKELINRGGEKIAPFEVEVAVQAVPGVASAVCFGLPDEWYGEKVAVAAVMHGRELIATGERRAGTDKEEEKEERERMLLACPLLPFCSRSVFARLHSSLSAPAARRHAPWIADGARQAVAYQILAHCRAVLPAFKVPSTYYLLPSAAMIPVTSTGKPQRARIAGALESHGITAALDSAQVRKEGCRAVLAQGTWEPAAPDCGTTGALQMNARVLCKSAYVAPQTAMEAAMVDSWEEVRRRTCCTGRSLALQGLAGS